MLLRLASYNVHGFVGRDGKYDLERTAAVLREIDADIVGLQEVAATPVHPDPWREIADMLEAIGLPGPTLMRGDSFYGNAIVTRLPVDSSREVDLSVAGREPRGALLTTIAGLHVVVTHLGLRAKERRAQALRLASVLDELDGGSVVVLADANTPWPWSSLLRPLDRRLGTSPRLATFPAHRPILPLDRIWVAGVERDRTWVHTSRLARTASDHLAVCTVLNLE